MYSITLNFNFKPVCLLAFPKPDSLGKVTKVKSISEETKCVKEIHNWYYSSISILEEFWKRSKPKKNLMVQ